MFSFCFSSVSPFGKTCLVGTRSYRNIRTAGKIVPTIPSFLIVVCDRLISKFHSRRERIPSGVSELRLKVTGGKGTVMQENTWIKDTQVMHMYPSKAAVFCVERTKVNIKSIRARMSKDWPL